MTPSGDVVTETLCACCRAEYGFNLKFPMPVRYGRKANVQAWALARGKLAQMPAEVTS